MKTMLEKYLVMGDWKLEIGNWKFRISDSGLSWKSLLLLIFLVSFNRTGLGQTQPGNFREFTLLQTLNVQANNFTTDNLQNLYILSNENEVHKYNSKGELEFQYPNQTLGKIGGIDASSPFHILLFFPEYQNLMLLDRTLSVTSQISLFNLGFFRVPVACMASDSKLWLYDEIEFRLKKISEKGSVITDSGDLSLTLGKNITPNYLIEKEQKVFLNVPELGVLVFDAFGRYLKTLPLKWLSDFQVFDGSLLFVENDMLQSFHLQTLLQKPVALPSTSKSVQKVRIERDRIYLMEPNRVQVYRYL